MSAPHCHKCRCIMYPTEEHVPRKYSFYCRKCEGDAPATAIPVPPGFWDEYVQHHPLTDQVEKRSNLPQDLPDCDVEPGLR